MSDEPEITENETEGEPSEQSSVTADEVQEGAFSETLGYATYSLEDDKLRFYPNRKLKGEYQHVWDEFKRMGFGWAPRQQCLFQVWGPGREDICLLYAEDIEAEDTTREERAEARSERFNGYSDHAGARAESAESAVEQITDGIPLGQPILIGHHSQRRAERDAEKIQNGMRRVVMEMRKAEYWSDRAERVIHHAKYLERPDVILRRIKKLEADRRRYIREASAEYYATRIDWWRSDFKRDHCGGKSWDVELTPEEEERWKEHLLKITERISRRTARWVQHLDNRITYERKLYEAMGGENKQEIPLEVGGAFYTHYHKHWVKITRVNRKNGEVQSISLDVRSWPRVVKIDQISRENVKTKAEFEAFLAENGDGHDQARALQEAQRAPAYAPYEPSRADQIEEAANNITVVGGVPSLFPTPPALIETMFALKEPEGFVLEPSCGTANILKALTARGVSLENIRGVEINYRLAEAVRAMGYEVSCTDFMEYTSTLVVEQEGEPVTEYFDRIYMNPPFEDMQGIDHFRHAYDLLKEGGFLVAILPESYFWYSDRKAREFREWLEILDAYSLQNPPEAFVPSGTRVPTRTVLIEKV